MESIMTKNEKADVLQTVNLELLIMFGMLHTHYSRPEIIKALPELEKIEIYLRKKLSEYVPVISVNKPRHDI